MLSQCCANSIMLAIPSSSCTQKVLGSVAGGLVVSRLTGSKSVHGKHNFYIFFLRRACWACHVSIVRHASTVRMSFDANSMQNGSPLLKQFLTRTKSVLFQCVVLPLHLQTASSIHLQELRRDEVHCLQHPTRRSVDHGVHLVQADLHILHHQNGFPRCMCDGLGL